ncbi:uncharacterized protein LOC130052338 [Ostrea edulis]|uniref:uncharacterized protein LOC130052338 n=1 Tax=Ostrea edulis TaxID=37623 RepID=UPI0024AE98F4|nr:uncharacterized protein LOC130052338 [Ostrea edulis]
MFHYLAHVRMPDIYDMAYYKDTERNQPPPPPPDSQDDGTDAPLLYVGVFLILVALVLFGVLFVAYVRKLKHTRDLGVREQPKMRDDCGKSEPNRYADMKRQYTALAIPDPKSNAYTPVPPTYIEIIS